jgi:hypothetical protein
MPVIRVAADANHLGRTGHKIFPRPIVVRRLMLKNDLPAISGPSVLRKADDQQKLENDSVKEFETRFKGPIFHRC